MKGLRMDFIEIKKISVLEVFIQKLVILTVLTAFAVGFGFSGAAHSTEVDPTDPTLDGKHDLPAILPNPGDYNGILGGKFPPPGNAINGDNASGGTFRALDEDFGFFPEFAWGKDDFFSNQQGVAFTLRNNGIAVWDNNGIEDGSHATINKVCIGGANIGDACNADGDCPGSTCSSTSFYQEAFGELIQPACCTDPRSDNGQIGVGRNHAFGMSNFLDFIYASRVELLAETTIDEIIAYFDGDGPPSDPFNPNDPRLRYRMNIWSASEDPLLPTYTGSFVGDVMSTDSTPGTFTRSDTGVRRDFHSTTTSLINDPIFRLRWIPDNPIVLPAGVYYFSHDVRLKVFKFAISRINGGPNMRLIKNRQNSINITGGTPGARVALVWGFRKGNGTIRSGVCRGTQVDIGRHTILAKIKLNQFGHANRQTFFVPSTSAHKAFIQLLDLGNCMTGERMKVRLLAD